MSEALEKKVSAEILPLGLILRELIVKVLSGLAIGRVVFVARVRVHLSPLPSRLVKVIKHRGVKREVINSEAGELMSAMSEHELMSSEVMTFKQTSVAVID